MLDKWAALLKPSLIQLLPTVLANRLSGSFSGTRDRHLKHGFARLNCGPKRTKLPPWSCRRIQTVHFNKGLLTGYLCTTRKAPCRWVRFLFLVLLYQAGLKPRDSPASASPVLGLLINGMCYNDLAKITLFKSYKSQLLKTYIETFSIPSTPLVFKNYFHLMLMENSV